MKPVQLAILRTPEKLMMLMSNQAGITTLPYVQKGALLDAWSYLSRVRSANTETLRQVLVVLQETVPDRSVAVTIRPLPKEWFHTPAAAKPTSAHPRAFQGTKTQLPKARRLPVLDLRPYLCDPRMLKEVLHALGGTAEKQEWSLPALFVTHFWLTARHWPTAHRSEMLALFSRLNLDGDKAILNGAARLAVVAEARLACLWTRVAESVPPEHRAAYFNAVIDTQVYATRLMHDAIEAIAETGRVAPAEQFPIWITALLKSIKENAPLDYLCAGFRLASLFKETYRFERVGKCANVPEQVIEDIGMTIPDGEYVALDLWGCCARFPGFANWIARSQWRSFDPEAAKTYSRFLVGLLYSDLRESTQQMKWAVIAKQLPKIEGLILKTSKPYQKKVVDWIWEWTIAWNDPRQLESRLSDGMKLLHRMAAAPFAKSDEAGSTVASFLSLPNAGDREDFLAIPDASLISLEAACRRRNDAHLIGRGIGTLTTLLGRNTLEAAILKPNVLWRAAKILGGVRYHSALEIVRECSAHPYFHADPLAIPVSAPCPGVPNPIPARLGAWMRGEITLSAPQIERFRKVVANNLVVTRMSLIQQSALTWLKRGLPVEQVTRGGEHALRLLGDIDENRRGLRKFLKAYWSGNSRYLADHPATKAWYRKHPALPRELWEQGITFPHDTYRIAVEQDPLEVLQLGTYVGSCLGLGGPFAYSAVAALLDANKRVLYARDQTGKVVARQLVAISDDSSLVCYFVYPRSASYELKALFRDYDRAFADAMNLPLYEDTEDGEGYFVSSVLSVDWWDDYAWNFEIPK